MLGLAPQLRVFVCIYYPHCIGFESQAYLQFIQFIFGLCVKRTKIKRKRGRVWPIKKSQLKVIKKTCKFLPDLSIRFQKPLLRPSVTATSSSAASVATTARMRTTFKAVPSFLPQHPKPSSGAKNIDLKTIAFAIGHLYSILPTQVLRQRAIYQRPIGTRSNQSYKASMIVIYESRVVNMSNLLLAMTLES